MGFLDRLIHNKSNERLRRMMEAIRTRDFSLQYSLDNMTGEEKSLAQQINAVINEFRDTMMAQEAQYQYFDTLLNTVNAFLIVADENDKVRWMNRAAIEGLCGFKIANMNDLASLSETLPNTLHDLRPGVQVLISIPTVTDKSGKEFAVNVVNFFNKGLNYKLYSLQNVQTVIQQSETEAQQQLVRVLTHEIMNSLTPIISLSDTLCEGAEQETLDRDDMLMALHAINRRSSGLLQFVQNYRKLQRVSAPQYSDVVIGELIDDLRHLYPAPYFHFNIDNPTLVIRIDRSQIEQVLINLLKNADEAVSAMTGREGWAASVDLAVVSTQNSKGRGISITITDNGCGIMPDVLERIFVPFFTTKSGGSGIGLAICKQIIGLHGGSIVASSVIDDHTTFTITLPI